MRRSYSLATLGLVLIFSASRPATPAKGEETITGPLAAKLTEKPPELSIGGKDAREIKAKIKSHEIKLVTPITHVPAGVETSFDVEYGKGGSTPMVLDLFTPKEIKKPVPGLIFVHGGSWRSGSRKHYGNYCRHFAQKGYVAATIDYRLSKEAPFPAAIQDVNCAIRWTRANAAKLGVDPNKIGLVGGSAGGHLVMLAAYANANDPELQGTGGNNGVSSRVQAVVDIYGPNQLSGRGSKAVVAFLGGKTWREAPDLYAKASPITHLTKEAPPTLILHGTIDELVNISQSDKLAAKLSELGVPYLYDRIEGWHHAMDVVAEVNAHCTWMMDQFFAQVLPLPGQ